MSNDVNAIGSGISSSHDIPGVCGQCLHFHAIEPDALSIGQERKGECRAMPPAVVAIPVKQGPSMGIVFQACHPVVPETFPCCGLFTQGEQESLMPLLPLDFPSRIVGGGGA